MTISSPRDEARVDQESVTLAGLVASGKGVGRVVVTVNGIEVSRLEEQKPQPVLAVNLSLELRARGRTSWLSPPPRQMGWSTRRSARSTTRSALP